MKGLWNSVVKVLSSSATSTDHPQLLDEDDEDPWGEDEDDDDFCPDCWGITIQYCPECHRVDPDA